MPRHCCACFFRWLMGLNVDNGVSQLVRWNKNASVQARSQTKKALCAGQISGHLVLSGGFSPLCQVDPNEALGENWSLGKSLIG